MLKEWLTADHIQLCERVEDWRQAVTLSAQPLLQDGVITPNYLTAIFHQQEKLGPYFVWHRASPCRTPGRRRAPTRWDYRC